MLSKFQGLKCPPTKRTVRHNCPLLLGKLHVKKKKKKSKNNKPKLADRFLGWRPVCVFGANFSSNWFNPDWTLTGVGARNSANLARIKQHDTNFYKAMIRYSFRTCAWTSAFHSNFYTCCPCCTHINGARIVSRPQVVIKSNVLCTENR